MIYDILLFYFFRTAKPVTAGTTDNVATKVTKAETAALKEHVRSLSLSFLCFSSLFLTLS